VEHTSTAMQHRNSIRFRMLAVTHVHAMIRSIIPVAVVYKQLICKLSWWKWFFYKNRLITIQYSHSPGK
jgi:hypothetical protein